MGNKRDIPYGQGIIEVFRPFIQTLLASRLSEKTIKHHLENLWLLGGEIIRDVHMNKDYENISPLESLREAVELDGGPFCRHLRSESEIKSFDATCRKLHRFLESFPG
jgi:hypothetical protein